MEITKEKFIEAWNLFSPAKIEKFYFKYFSKEAKNRKLSWIVAFLLLLPFLLGYIGTILNINRNFISIVTTIYSFELIIFSIPWIYSYYKHKRRINKIISYLKISIEEYNKLADMYSDDLKKL